jgi:TetR/AcrR family transcriptional regulator, cholesterol catabolism regulator
MERREGQALGLRERKKLEVERRIREAAARLFSERGYEHTTVEDIAAAADVSKGTFFNYFARKDALLVALAEELMESLRRDLGPVESWQGPVEAQLRRFFLYLAAHAEQDPSLSKTMVVENMRTYWLREGDDRVEQAFRDLVIKVLEAGRSRGEFACEFDSTTAARLLEAAYALTLVEWLREGSVQAGLKDAISAKFDIIFRGLGSVDAHGEGAA